MTQRSRLLSCLLYGINNNYLLLCFCKPVIGPWALRENNALQFSHNQPIRARVISATNTSHIIKHNIALQKQKLALNFIGNTDDWGSAPVGEDKFLQRVGRPRALPPAGWDFHLICDVWLFWSVSRPWDTRSGPCDMVNSYPQRSHNIILSTTRLCHKATPRQLESIHSQTDHQSSPRW